MKRYFDFTLTGKKFFPIWIIFYIITIVPNTFLYLMKINVLEEPEIFQRLSPFLSWGIIVFGFLISFYIYKIRIEYVKFNNSQLKFDGKFSTYLGKILVGILLSIVTLFIYVGWFIKDITQFFVNNSTLEDERFDFKGKGGTLFWILLLSAVIPFVVLTIFFDKQVAQIYQNFVYLLIFQGVMMIILIPYLYLTYNWTINIKYKDYHIKWNTNFFKSCGKILFEFLLIIITLGIYYPLAYLKLFKYFSERTIAEKETSSLQFGYELDAKNDFIFIWKQLLITLVTLCIYYPWAYSKIGKMVLSKTYVTEIDQA